MDRYILDTSCLTQAFRGYYPFDLAPTFWSFLKAGILDGRFIIIDKVCDEINKGNDELKEWLNKEIPHDRIFVTGNTSTMDEYLQIMVWGNGHSQYNYSAKEDFSEFENADPFVVAAAIHNSAIVVSQEVSAPASIKNIKLPDVCTNFGVTHISTFEFMRANGFSM